MSSTDIEAVFISDLHLNPQQPAITDRFIRFIHWAAEHTKTLYILGDFFHVWSGDDSLDTWSAGIADQLTWLSNQGCTIYLMPGNRDFLLGKRFAARARLTLLSDPLVIVLGNERLLLTHGDRYCLHDRAHQRFRRLTRNSVFKALFLLIPRRFRAKLVSQVRDYSQSNRSKPQWTMEIVVPKMLEHMQKMNTRKVIHGHIHQPGLNKFALNGDYFEQYVLSDWDDNPSALCYYKTKGFMFSLI